MKRPVPTILEGPLMGPDAPPHPKHIFDLLRLLLTIYHRFGNTAVTFNLQWGSSALWQRDALIEELAETKVTLEAKVDGLVTLNMEAAIREREYLDKTIALLGHLDGLTGLRQGIYAIVEAEGIKRFDIFKKQGEPDH